MNYVVYKNSNGQILRVGECNAEDFENQALTGQTVIEDSADDREHYISGSAVTSRPTITATWDKTSVTANGSDTATLGSTLPNPTSVSVAVPDGAVTPDDEVVTGGTFSFATSIAGNYIINVTPPFPYLSHTQVIVAT